LCVVKIKASKQKSLNLCPGLGAGYREAAGLGRERDKLRRVAARESVEGREEWPEFARRRWSCLYPYAIEGSGPDLERGDVAERGWLLNGVHAGLGGLYAMYLAVLFRP